MNATPVNQEQQRRAERRARIERWNAPVLERRVDVAERVALEPSLRPHVAKARKGGSSLNPVMDTDDSERALILAEEGGTIVESEADAREAAIWRFCDTAGRAAERRTRAYIVDAENSMRTQFELRPKVEQEKTLRDAVLALHGLLTKGRLQPVLPKRFSQRAPAEPFPYTGLSVRPRDLHSGVHVSDILYLLGQPARLWRLIVREGLTIGALLFEEREDAAVTLASMGWWPGDPFDPSEPKTQREINACLAAMNGPCPETLPDSSWLKSDCETWEAVETRERRSRTNRRPPDEATPPGAPGPQPSGLPGKPVERDPAAAEGKGPHGPAGQVLPLYGGEYPGEIDPDALVECWSRSGDTIAILGLRLDIVGGERIRVRVGFVLKSADRPWSAQADALVLARWADVVDAPAGDAWCSLVSNLAAAQARSGIGVRFKIELRRAAGALPPWRLAGVREYF
jgi:hypothetical protein